MPALRELVVSRLKDAGVRMIFGVPGGGGNLDLIEAAGQADLPFVLSATETGGALAALAQAEVTGRPGACLTTLGPGAASVANGVACALLDRVPLLVFTDSHAAAANGAFEHQQFDHRAFFRPITKWSGRLSAECADRTLDQAFASLLDPPPGPVHIDWPADFEATPGRSSPESRAPSPESRAPSPESRAPSPESRASSPESRAPSVETASFIAANEADLARALETARQCQGPCLIEAKIDKSNYSRTLEVVRG
jgi:acetolactate synthase-1/2/3 large subunit